MTKRVRKRQYGSGAVVAPTKPGGTWAIRYRVGKARRYQGGIPTREMAERALAKLQVDDAASELGLPKRASNDGVIGDYAPAFLARRKLTHAAAQLDAQRWRKHLAPTFDKLRPNDVDVAVIRRYVDAKLTEGLGPGTIRVCVALLSSLYVELVEDGVAAKNPARGLPPRLVKAMTSTHDPRTVPFVERMSDVQRIYADLERPLNIAYAIGAFAGLRTSEVFGLRWRHVDLAARRIHVREQRARASKGQARQLKDKESRMVPILDPLLPVLTRWHLETGGEADALVVPPMRRDAKYVDLKVSGRHIKRTLERLGLARPGLGWYEATRHTFASQWVMSGGSIEKLKEILGHYSVVMTERYAHLKPELFTARDLSTLQATLVDEPAPVLSLCGGEK